MNKLTKDQRIWYVIDVPSLPRRGTYIRKYLDNWHEVITSTGSTLEVLEENVFTSELDALESCSDRLKEPIALHFNRLKQCLMIKNTVDRKLNREPEQLMDLFYGNS